MTVKTPNASQKIEREPAGESIRDSIRAAVDEENKKVEAAEKKEEADEKEEIEEKEEKIDAKSEEKVEETQEEKSADEKPADEETEEKEEKTEKKVSAPVKAKGIQPIPYGLAKEIRAKWTDYDDETQQFITKLCKDANDGRSLTGRVSAELRDVDAVLAPKRQEIARLGVTPAQVVKKVLEYVDGLAGPNNYQMLQQIAKDFNLDLTRFGKPAKQQTLGANAEQTDAESELIIDLPPEVHQKLDRILAQHEQNTTSAQEASRKAAEDTVHAWSGFNAATGEHKSKPYFPYVRQTMFALMQANPNSYLTLNGQVDLDRVYDDACHADPELRELVAENARLEQQRTEAEQKKKEKKKADIVAAKSKNVSLRPSAGSLGSSQSNLNGKTPNKKGPESVRESLISAIQENR